MKILKTMAVIAGLLCAYSAEAQFQKGSILLGAEVGFNIDFKDKKDPDDYKTPYFFDFNVSGGYFLNGRNEIALRLGAGTDRFFTDGGVEIKRNSYLVGTYWRNYKLLSSKLSFGWATGLSYSTDIYTVDDPAGPLPDEKYHEYQIFGRPSLTYMIHPKVGLRANLGAVRFEFFKAPFTTDAWDKDFGFNFSPEFVDFGVVLLLHGTGTGE